MRGGEKNHLKASTSLEERVLGEGMVLGEERRHRQNEVRYGRPSPWVDVVVWLFSLLFVSKPAAFFPGRGCPGAGLTSLPSLSPLGAKVSEETVTPTRARSRKEKAAGSREATREKRSSGRGRRGLGTGAPTRPPETDQSGVDTAASLGRSAR